MEFAEELKQFDPKKKIKEPFVIGAVIDLGRCLDLLDSKAIGIVKSGYESVKNAYERLQSPLPQNKPLRGSKDLILRRLDCASVEAAHQIMHEAKEPSYDTVRGTFVKGDPLYENSGFYAKTHIQLSETILRFAYAPRYSVLSHHAISADTARTLIHP